MNSATNSKTDPMNHSSFIIRTRDCALQSFNSFKLSNWTKPMLNVPSTSENEMIINYLLFAMMNRNEIFIRSKEHIHIRYTRCAQDFRIKSCSLFITLFPFNSFMIQLLKWISVLCRHISWYVFNDQLIKFKRLTERFSVSLVQPFHSYE